MGAFPHSDIHGSTFICNSPWLFAACHVLLRRLMPRHPPYALFSLSHSYLSVCLPSGNKKTFVSVLVLFLLARHLLRYFLLYSTISHVLCSMLLTRSRFSSTSRFNVYFLFSLCSCQCTKMFFRGKSREPPSKGDSLISIP